MLEPAPLFTDVSPAPLEGSAYWATTVDGRRIRIADWVPANARATVLLFPGRTEYIEKYAPIAGDLAERGYATVAIDWRGQGLADRMLDDPRIGHVHIFEDYQIDVGTLMDAIKELNLPTPYFLLAHSMGGCIGLRALLNGLPVAGAAFTSPMWGIRISPHLRPLAWALGYVMPAIGQGHRLPPTTELNPYVLSTPFHENRLTSNPDMYQMMQRQIRAHPELALGGPSIVWLREALIETQALTKLLSPDVPCITFLGTNEQIVHTGRILSRMENWSIGKLYSIDDGEHEVLMEGPEMRAFVFDAIESELHASTHAG